MSWDEAFSRRYDQWSAHMTEDIAFYVALAREDGQARVRAADAGVELDLRRSDMREFALDEPAGRICPFRALLHLPSWADRRRTFERVVTGLRPGGRLAWSAFAFDPHIAARLAAARRPSSGRAGATHGSVRGR